MSIRVMSMVWEHSSQKGSALIVLLALADFADDNGRCYPGVTTLAAKARLSERNARYVLGHLAKTGELHIEANAGPRGTNLYTVLIRKNLPLFPVDSGGAKIAVPPAAQRTDPLQPSVRTPAIAIAPEPSGTIKEAAAPVSELSTSQAAAAARLYFSPKLNPAECSAAALYLMHFPQAQLVLDELAGMMQKKSIANPLGMLRTLAQQAKRGQLLPSHAPRIEAERELDQVQQELHQARAAGRHS